jgi:hypothetical protein
MNFLLPDTPPNAFFPGRPTGEVALLKKPFSHADLSIAIRNIMPRPTGKPTGEEVIAGA